MDQVRPKIYFVLGGPGAGKGTQCAILVSKWKFIHLSAGELLREERERKTEYGDLIENLMLSGQIVPSHITVKLLNQAMIEKGLDNIFLIDGFPRNQENLEKWNELMEDKIDFKRLLYFDCDEEILKERIKARAIESGRTDDNAETMIKRLITYNQATKPIIDYFDQLGKVVKIVADKSIDQVLQQIEELLSLK